MAKGRSKLAGNLLHHGVKAKDVLQVVKSSDQVIHTIANSTYKYELMRLRFQIPKKVIGTAMGVAIHHYCRSGG